MCRKIDFCVEVCGKVPVFAESLIMEVAPLTSTIRRSFSERGCDKFDLTGLSRPLLLSYVEQSFEGQKDLGK